jgi:hypothetical protein
MSWTEELFSAQITSNANKIRNCQNFANLAAGRDQAFEKIYRVDLIQRKRIGTSAFIRATSHIMKFDCRCPVLPYTIVQCKN